MYQFNDTIFEHLIRYKSSSKKENLIKNHAISCNAMYVKITRMTVFYLSSVMKVNYNMSAYCLEYIQVLTTPRHAKNI